MNYVEITEKSEYDLRVLRKNALRKLFDDYKEPVLINVVREEVRTVYNPKECSYKVFCTDVEPDTVDLISIGIVRDINEVTSIRLLREELLANITKGFTKSLVGLSIIEEQIISDAGYIAVELKYRYW